MYACVCAYVCMWSVFFDMKECYIGTEYSVSVCVLGGGVGGVGSGLGGVEGEEVVRM